METNYAQINDRSEAEGFLADKMQDLDDNKVNWFINAVDSNLAFKECTRCSENDVALLKPPRTRHCKFCDRCCMKLDHHCYWIGNCIGIYNTKFFFQYGFYIFIADCIMIPAYLPFLYDIWSTISWSEHK